MSTVLDEYENYIQIIFWAQKIDNGKQQYYTAFWNRHNVELTVVHNHDQQKIFHEFSGPGELQ